MLSESSRGEGGFAWRWDAPLLPMRSWGRPCLHRGPAPGWLHGLGAGVYLLRTFQCLQDGDHNEGAPSLFWGRVQMEALRKTGGMG